LFTAGLVLTGLKGLEEADLFFVRVLSRNPLADPASLDGIDRLLYIWTILTFRIVMIIASVNMLVYCIVMMKRRHFKPANWIGFLFKGRKIRVLEIQMSLSLIFLVGLFVKVFVYLPFYDLHPGITVSVIVVMAILLFYFGLFALFGSREYIQLEDLTNALRFNYSRESQSKVAEEVVMDMVRSGVVTKKLTLTISYDRTSLSPSKLDPGKYVITGTDKLYAGKIGKDHYGRITPYHAHGTGNLEEWSASTKNIVSCMMQLYDRIVDPELMVRRISICICNVIPEEMIPEDDAPVQLELFVDYEKLEREKAERERKAEREKALQKATLRLQDRFGKNSVLKGMSLVEGAMTKERNSLIGGHRAGDET
jgi:hypothetical protein